MEKNNYELFDEQVDRFLRHQMTAEEEHEFRTQLASNPDLKRRAQLTALMIKEMQAVGREQDHEIVAEVKGMSEAEFRQAAGLKPKLRVRRFWPQFVKYAAAACVTGFLIVGGYKYYDFRQTVSLGDSQYMAYVQDISDEAFMRGTNDDAVIDKLLPLFDNVRDGKDLKQTIAQLEPLYEQSHNEESPYSEFDNDIAWNLAIAYLKDGDKKKPVPILEYMIEHNKEYQEIYQPAQDLLDQIKNL